MIVLFLLKGIVFFFQSYLMNIIAQRAIREVRDAIYAKLQDLSMSFYARKRTGELISRITHDVAYIANAISYGLTDLVFESMKVVFFAFLVFYLNAKLALISLVLFPAIMLPVVRIGKRIKKFSLEVQKKMADLNSLLTETIQGAYIVKVFSREDYELQRFKEINRQYYKFTMKGIKRIIALSPLTEFIGVIGGVVVLWIAVRDVLTAKLSFGVFGVFMGALMQMIRPFKKISNVHAINQQAFAAQERIYDILEEEPKIHEKPDAGEIKDIKEGITFEGVWFQYEESDDFALKDIHLEVRRGSIIALVGHSGAGKSTLVSLIPRLYDPQEGTVRIDGIDVRSLRLKSLRDLIAVVSQDMVLFNTTVRDNIAYGSRVANVDEGSIIEAAKKAHAFEFINKLPAKFDTLIGDRGFLLSGGERQRLSIARAILKDAPILILDEATSQLDSEAEELIKHALYNLMQGKTTLVIAHRLSTVQQADCIVVMEKGRIVEEGSHTALLSQDTLYKKLYELQFNV